MTTVINAYEYPANCADNTFGDWCALVQLAIRAPHPIHRHNVEVKHWMLISSLGKSPRILTDAESVVAMASLCNNTKGHCHAIENAN